MPRPPLPVVLTASAVVAAAVAVVIAAVAAGGGGAAATPTAVVVGDSLSFEAGPEIERAAAAADVDVRVDAVPGSSLGQRVADIADAAAAVPDAVVVALGTNDVYYDLAGQPAAVRRTLAAARDVPCLVWVLVGVVPGRSAASFNRMVMTAAEDAGGRMHVVRWDRISAGHDGWIAADGIHHTPTGRRAFADAMVDGIRSCADRR